MFRLTLLWLLRSFFSQSGYKQSLLAHVHRVALCSVFPNVSSLSYVRELRPMIRALLLVAEQKDQCPLQTPTSEDTASRKSCQFCHSLRVVNMRLTSHTFP